MWIKFDAGDVDADLSCDHELCENQCSKSYSFLECVNESTSIFSSMYDGKIWYRGSEHDAVERLLVS